MCKYSRARALAAFSKKMDTLTPDDEWIETGAGLDEKNYQTWNITHKGLEITFNPYQVASYAEGPQVVVIPFPVLTNLIDPKGPIARLAGKRSI